MSESSLSDSPTFELPNVELPVAAMAVEMIASEGHVGSRGDVVFKTWAFCPISGSLLILDAARGVARSEQARFERPLSDLDDTMEVVTQANMPDYQRRYALEPLLKTKEQLAYEALLRNRVRATVEEPCPRCKNPVLEYYTMQLRSADEGQTVFYECRKCRYRYSTNN